MLYNVLEDSGAFLTFAFNTYSTTGHRVTGYECSLVVYIFEIALARVVAKQSIAGIPL